MQVNSVDQVGLLETLLEVSPTFSVCVVIYRPTVVFPFKICSFFYYNYCVVIYFSIIFSTKFIFNLEKFILYKDRIDSQLMFGWTRLSSYDGGIRFVGLFLLVVRLSFGVVWDISSYMLCFLHCMYLSVFTKLVT